MTHLKTQYQSYIDKYPDIGLSYDQWLDFKNELIKEVLESDRWIQVRFKDTDPDTGNISQDKLIALCTSDIVADCIYTAVSKLHEDSDDPNRDIYIKHTT